MPLDGQFVYGITVFKDGKPKSPWFIRDLVLHDLNVDHGAPGL